MEDAPTLTESDTMRAMAARYFRLAKDTEDQRERSKYFDYAMVYAQLSRKAGQRETSTAMAGGDVESRNVPERGDVLARSHGR
jgi:hypothetical protein